MINSISLNVFNSTQSASQSLNSDKIEVLYSPVKTIAFKNTVPLPKVSGVSQSQLMRVLQQLFDKSRPVLEALSKGGPAALAFARNASVPVVAVTSLADFVIRFSKLEEESRSLPTAKSRSTQTELLRQAGIVPDIMRAALESSDRKISAEATQFRQQLFTAERLGYYGSISKKNQADIIKDVGRQFNTSYLKKILTPIQMKVWTSLVPKNIDDAKYEQMLKALASLRSEHPVNNISDEAVQGVLSRFGFPPNNNKPKLPKTCSSEPIGLGKKLWEIKKYEDLTPEIHSALNRDPLTINAVKALIERSIQLGYTLTLKIGGVLEVKTPTKTETLRLPYDLKCSFTDEDWKKIHNRANVYKKRLIEEDPTRRNQ
jgi:hypothetical protein